MNGQILKFDDSVHREADEILPWFVNGTLEDRERAMVEQHLRECARCRREVELLWQLHSVCALDVAAKDATPSYGRLRARMAGGGGLSALRNRLQALQRPWQRVPAWAQWAIAAELAGIVVLGAIVMRPISGSDTIYRTLGAAPVRASRHDSVAVVFFPDTREAELRRIVQAAGARLIDGPTESNAYVLEIPDGQQEKTLTLLRAEPTVVLAQPLTAQAGR